MDHQSPKARGEWGETVALEYLKKRGYAVVDRRFRSRFGEIDLIVKNGEFIAFVEVKTRKNANFAHAREYVSKQKQSKIRATASFWLLSHKTRLQPRFDVMEVYAPFGVDTKSPEVNHIENAF